MHDVIVIGAGAAGMMCAGVAGQRGRRVAILDHAKTPGEKIRISGGGRCNFTNRHASPAQFLSANPRFCISALSRYTQQDFIALIERHGIAYHEKTLGQLFCDGSAQQVTDLLLSEMRRGDVELCLNAKVERIEKISNGFALHLSGGEEMSCRALVIASGGKSIPKMGASDFGYRVAAQFGLDIVPTRPALVPLTFDETLLKRLSALSGVATQARVRHGRTAFEEALLFTHRGLSGPAILQISSYWREGDEIRISLLPGGDAFALLRAARAEYGKQEPQTFLATLLPRRLAKDIVDAHGCTGNLADQSDAKLRELADAINDWRITPSGSEGYRTAEVTAGGVDTKGLNSTTMEAKTVPGLYFIGEVVDVTGWLGGYNFQWAWSSGWCAGRVV
ncbi:MAG: NAD(P)/FAD-dependent oxidoreductase [Alphaproteobacteria bacterium]|nr:NAD(P)/FAD-dependent oxidoreductase [Alphaproteobacteria bacterium]